ncbi:unnamed protein product [Diamesa serratosioi]
MNGVFSSNEDDEREVPSEICCLLEDGVKCRRNAGNASYSKRIQKTVISKKLKFTLDTMARHNNICDFHKGKIQSARKRRRNKGSASDSDESDSENPEVDLLALQVNTLRRYKKYYKVSTRPGMNKAQLADAISKHFRTIPVKEKEIVNYFIYMVKTNSNKMDYKNGITEN